MRLFKHKTAEERLVEATLDSLRDRGMPFPEGASLTSWHIEHTAEGTYMSVYLRLNR